MENKNAHNYASVKFVYLYKELDKEWKFKLRLKLMQWFFFQHFVAFDKFVWY
jgi:hypothetical protein